VTLGKQGRSRSPLGRLGSTALRALAGAPVALLLVEHRRAGAYRPRRALVVSDGSEGAGRALDAAVSVAEASGVPLNVLAIADAPARERQTLQVDWRSLPSAKEDTLLRAIQSDEAALLVLSLSARDCPNQPSANYSSTSLIPFCSSSDCAHGYGRVCAVQIPVPNV
jgi:hypothetical protein